MSDAIIHALDAAAQNADWQARLQVNGKGAPKGNLFNVLTAMRHSVELAGAVQWNEFRLQTDVIKALPWNSKAWRPWDNFDDVRLTEWLQDHDVGVGLEIVQQAVDAVAAENARHPLREWLAGLKWDGEARVDRWLTYHLGVEPNDYTEQVGRCWLLSAVARVFRPGCKADHVLVLEGPQGKGKSTALRVLTGADWFTDELADLGSKDAAMQTRGVWVVELSELDQLNRGEVTRIKAFITRTVDRFRPPYGRRVVEAPRECVFAGTVNNNQYLKDDTGNRRFWPVEITTIDVDGLKAEREQIWAETVMLFRQGYSWWLDSEDAIRRAEEEQSKRQVVDPWMSRIENYSRGQDTLSISDILGNVLEKRTGDWNRGDEMRVSSCLNIIGFARCRVTGRNGQREWVYRRRP